MKNDNSSVQPSVKFSRHFENCSAPICFEVYGKDGHNPVWYPQELICLVKHSLSPAQKHVKKVQLRINRLALKGKFRFIDRAFTFEMLSKIKNVTIATKGLNPEHPLELKRFQQSTFHDESLKFLERATFIPKRERDCEIRFSETKEQTWLTL